MPDTPKTSAQPVKSPHKLMAPESSQTSAAEFQQLLLNLSQMTTDSKAGDATELLNTAIQQFGEFAGADRAYIVRFESDSSVMDLSHQWAAEGVSLSHKLLTRVPSGLMPWLQKRVRGLSELFELASIDELPADAEIERKIWQEQKVKRVLAVQLRSANTPLGYVGLTRVHSDTAWSDAEKQQLLLAGQLIGNLLQQVEADRDLLFHRKLEHLIGQLSQAFISIELDKFDVTINQALRGFAELTGADRCLLYCYKQSDVTVVSATHSWARDDIPNPAGVFQEKPISDVAWLFRAVAEGAEIIIEDAADLPPEAQDEWYWVQETFGCQSLLVLPIRRGDHTVGALSIDAVHQHIHWDERIVASLRLAAQIIAQALDRYEREMALRKSEQRHRLLVEHAPEAILVLDPNNGRVLDTNPGACELLGYSADDLLLQSIDSISPPVQPCGTTSPILIRQLIRKAVSGLMPVTEWAAKRRDHRLITTEMRLLELPNPSGGKRLRATITDITKRKAADMALANSQRRFQAIYDQTPTIFFTVNARGNVLSCNQYGAKLLGYNRAELVGSRYADLHSGADAKHVAGLLADALAEPEEIHRIEVQIHRAKGLPIWVRSTCRLMPGESGVAASLLLVCEDISETRQLAEQLNFQANHDPLTGLTNRRAFEAQLEQLLADKQPRNSHYLCCMDLDRFKLINDSCGHLAGDNLLQQLSAHMEASAPPNCRLARLGGDEFAALLEAGNADDAVTQANALRLAVEEFRFVWGSNPFNVGISIGVVAIRDSNLKGHELISQADAACYLAKSDGRNRVHMHSSSDSEDLSLQQRQGDLHWATKLSLALETDDLALFAQPVAPLHNLRSLNREAPAHFEVLLRLPAESDGQWHEPRHFMAAAERYDLVGKIDRWVVKRTLNWLHENPKRTRKIELCTINLSGATLCDQSFQTELLQLLTELCVPAKKICFEITETVAVSNLRRAQKFIHDFKAIGCQFALDDFGSGLSSFGYLKNLPVDFLKIDGMFVRDIADDPIDFEFVKAINDIGHVMGKKTIAEYVENDAILDRLKTMGVDFVQGYKIGKPELLIANVSTRAANNPP